MPGSRRTDLVLLLVALVWGSSYLAAKTATGGAPVLTVLFLRDGISALALVPLVRGITRKELKAGLILGLTQARSWCWRRTASHTPAPRTPD